MIYFHLKCVPYLEIHHLYCTGLLSFQLSLVWFSLSISPACATKTENNLGSEISICRVKTSHHRYYLFSSNVNVMKYDQLKKITKIWINPRPLVLGRPRCGPGGFLTLTGFTPLTELVVIWSKVLPSLPPVVVWATHFSTSTSSIMSFTPPVLQPFLPRCNVQSTATHSSITDL